MARRRRAQYRWFPADPTFYGESQTGSYYWTNILAGEPGASGEIFATAVLPDQSYNDAQAGQSDNMTLRDYVEGQDYILKRMVGKVWGSLEQVNAADHVNSVILSMGFAILPVDDDTNAPALDSVDYDPLNPSNSMNPWIWRRTWILANLLGPDTNFYYPNNLGAYGSVMDGGHVDSKSARRVTREQRLFYIAAARTIESTGVVPEVQIQVGFDIRCLGAMRKGRNQSTFK